MSYTLVMDDQTLQTAGKRIVQLRSKYDLSQTALAALAGIDQSVLSRMERGEITEPSVSACQGLMGVFKLGVDPLFGGDVQWNDALLAVAQDRIQPAPSMWEELPQWLREDIADARHLMITGSRGSGKTQLLIDVLAGLKLSDPYIFAGEAVGTNELTSRSTPEKLGMYTVERNLAALAGSSFQELIVLPELQGTLERFELLANAAGRTMTTYHGGEVNDVMTRLGVGAAHVEVSLRPYLTRGVLVLHTQRLGSMYRVVEVAQLFNSRHDNPRSNITRHCITEIGSRRPPGQLRRIHDMIDVTP